MDGPEGRGAIPGTGLTVVFEPDEPSLDIVFIHGFTGHPERTWTSKNANTRQRNNDRIGGEFAEPPPKIRKLNPFSSSHPDKGAAVPATYWPRDLVPTTVPSARVLTYGYDTHIRHRVGPPVNRNTVYDMSWDFLVALESERRAEPSRPVLFVAHSLGGIIVKEMLRRSRGCQTGQNYLRDIFNSTIGVIFFGTPHAGADPRGFLQRIAERVTKAAGFSVNEQVVNALLPSSERLRELRDEFGPMAQEQNLAIHSFQEQVGVGLLNGQKVVDDTSAYVNVPGIEITEHIGRNHMDMCRFTGLDDVEYKKVAAALCRITTMVSRQPTTAGKSQLSAEQKRALLDSLRFLQIDARQMTIRKAHAQTCKWLLETPEYLDWLNPSKLGGHHGFLWIKGKPGAGKSTMMKFALANARKKMKDAIVISFFFNARGDDLEKSTVGMYRSLLLQLLEQLPVFQDVFNSLGLRTWKGGCQHWSIEALKALLEEVVQGLGELPVTCFIDALDECDEGQIRDMVSFFEHVGEMTTKANPPIRFQVCFSSRHYPHITIGRGLGLVLESQEEHGKDIARYLDCKLNIGHSELAKQIRAELQERSSGVFMWVVLVVEILNKEHDRGRIHALRRRLRDIPGDLHELFRNILMRDHHNRGELLLCIQWVLFARQPLKPEQLYFAILSGVEPEALSEWNPDEITAADMQRFILGSSKGLIEVTKSKSPTVQLIHESVKDFLLKRNGLRNIWPDVGGNLEGASHEQLKQCCLSYIHIDIATSLDIAGSLPTANTQRAAELRQSANNRFPFLEYATRNVLYHADAAEEGDISQMHFLQSFRLPQWIKLYNLFEPKEVRRYKAEPSFLYILSEMDLAALIKIHLPKQSCFEEEHERYGTPFFAALATESNKAVEAFIEFYSEIQPQGSPLRGFCKQFSENRKNIIKIGRSFKFKRERNALSYVAEQKDEAFLALFIASGQVNARDEFKRGPLSHAAQRGYKGVVQLLLETGQADIESKDSSGRTPLLWAAQGGHETVVRLLLETGQVDVESKDSSGRTPLSWAAQEGHETVVRLLLETGQVDIESKDRYGRTPLSWAAQGGHETVVRLLLETGQVDIESKDSYGRTLLLWAVQRGHEGIVQLLLKTGQVNIESKDSYGQTLLLWAVQRGHETVVRLLLETGQVDVESKDNYSQTLLLWAAQRGHETVVRLLLETGQVDVGSKGSSGRTPLSWAARGGHETVVRLLLETGQVDVESKDSYGRTPLLWAAQGGHEGIVQLLLKTGQVDVESKDSYGRTPLLWAAQGGHEGIVQLLLKTGQVNIESKDNYGQTPLSLAIARGHRAVERLLNTVPSPLKE